MSRDIESNADTSCSPPPSSAPEPIASISSVEPPEISGHGISRDEPSETKSDISWGGISPAFEEMDISGDGVESCAIHPMDSDPNDLVPADSQKDNLLTPDGSTFDMDLGKFLKDRLDGHVMSKF